MSIAFTFPGQGSQHVGMGAELAETFAVARDVFAEVDEALGQDLSRIMREGPEDMLTLTENAQPALMAVSLAVMRVLEHEHGLRLSDAGRCRRARSGRHGASAEDARAGHAGRCAGGRRRHGGPAGR